MDNFDNVDEDGDKFTLKSSSIDSNSNHLLTWESSKKKFPNFYRISENLNDAEFDNLTMDDINNYLRLDLIGLHKISEDRIQKLQRTIELMDLQLNGSYLASGSHLISPETDLEDMSFSKTDSMSATNARQNISHEEIVEFVNTLSPELGISENTLLDPEPIWNSLEQYMNMDLTEDLKSIEDLFHMTESLKKVAQSNYHCSKIENYKSFLFPYTEGSFDKYQENEDTLDASPFIGTYTSRLVAALSFRRNDESESFSLNNILKDDSLDSQMLKEMENQAKMALMEIDLVDPTAIYSTNPNSSKMFENLDNPYRDLMRNGCVFLQSLSDEVESEVDNLRKLARKQNDVLCSEQNESVLLLEKAIVCYYQSYTKAVHENRKDSFLEENSEKIHSLIRKYRSFM